MTTTHTPSASSPQRALAVDALRGIAILLMIFSSRIPFSVLPDWMYHAQVPPPSHVFDPTIRGITWVDLVFPFFLFTMGIAIPLALSRRIERGERKWDIVVEILQRGFLLAWFAMYVMQIRPSMFGPDVTLWGWLFCLTGFLLLFPMLARFPSEWKKSVQYGIRTVGWVGAALLMGTAEFADGTHFSFQRSDIIILVLSNVYVAGALLWLYTRDNFKIQAAVLACFFAIQLGSATPGFAQDLWNISPFPWLFQVRFLKYLFIVIPGIMIGNRVLRRMKAPPEDVSASIGRPRLISAALLALAVVAVVTVGLKARLVIESGLLAAGLSGCIALLLRNPKSADERLLMTFLQWGILLLIIGYFFEPYEGGIRKDHSTMSYYFVTGGLALFTLLALTVCIEIFKLKRGFSLLIQTGQNPLIAYAGVNSLVPPVLALTGLAPLIEQITPTPWLGVLRGAFYTYLVALAASWCASKKIFLKT